MDELGGGEWRLATVGCPRLAEALGCNQRFSVVFTYMRLNSASQPVRVVVAYEVEWKDDEERYMITRRRTQVTAIMFPAEAIEGGQRESDNPSTTGVWDSTFYPIEGA
jgi:hypothetical protein